MNIQFLWLHQGERVFVFLMSLPSPDMWDVDLVGREAVGLMLFCFPGP